MNLSSLTVNYVSYVLVFAKGASVFFTSIVQPMDGKYVVFVRILPYFARFFVA